MKIGILDYKACNLTSVYYSIYRLGYDPVIVKKAIDFKKIDKLIIPGVGSAKTCIDFLKKKNFIYEINNFLKQKQILGICLGMQIFAKKLYEGENTFGLGFFDADVIPLKDNKNNVGWLKVNIAQNNFLNHLDKKEFYFCHSFHFNLNSSSDKKYCIGYSKEKLVSIVKKENFIGTQFHPEKSQISGGTLIKNFIDWNE